MLGERIKEYRESHKLLQRQLAAELEVDTAYVSKIENNEKLVSKIHIRKLSKLLKISEKELHLLWVAQKLLLVVKSEKKEDQKIILEMLSNALLKNIKDQNN